MLRDVRHEPSQLYVCPLQSSLATHGRQQPTRHVLAEALSELPRSDPPKDRAGHEGVNHERRYARRKPYVVLFFRKVLQVLGNSHSHGE